MAMDIIPKAKFPNVPNVAGVPSLLRDPSKIIGTVAGVINIGRQIASLFGFGATTWGVFDSAGNTVAIADSVLSLDYANSSRVSNYPVEAGAFASYNKVANPYDVRVRLARGGTEAERSAFIKALDYAANSLNLYVIVTPEATYKDANIESFDYRRENTNGANIILAELRIVEIRQSAVASFSDPKNPAAAIAQSQGQVAAAPLSSATDAAIQGAAKALSSVKAVLSNPIVTGSLFAGSLLTSLRGITK